MIIISITLADFTDFSNETKILHFNTTHACVNIEIFDDKIVERDVGYFKERFQVTLEFGEENTASSLTTIVSHVIERNGHKSRIIAKFMY